MMTRAAMTSLILAAMMSLPLLAQPIDQGKNDPRLKGYFTPPGVKVEIVAEAPTVVNPVGMAFADDGTPFVLEWVADGGAQPTQHTEKFTYKDGSTRQFAISKKRVADHVKTLRWDAEKKVYDKATVVIEDELPSGILQHDGWLYLSGRGSVRRYRQSKPDGPYDVKEVIAQGFSGLGRRQVSGMTLGNDGWLYLTSGGDDNVVEGSDGSRATLLGSGGVFRCRPDGAKMHVYALGFRNPYRDVAFDSSHRMFHVDNEDGSTLSECRLFHVSEGSDFEQRRRNGLAPLLGTGRGTASGLLSYNDTRFPARFRGLLYYPDILRRSIRAYKVEPKGASFEAAEEFELLKSDDPLFRPCQALVGPDGAIYVVDWRTDSGSADRLQGDGKHGRIYRLTWTGTKEDEAIEPRGLDSWAKVRKLDDVALLEALAAEDFTDRERARQEIVKRGEKFRPALLKLLADGEGPRAGRLAVIGALLSMWNDDVSKEFLERVRDPDEDVRRLAVEGLGLNSRRGDKDVHAVLLKQLGDAELAVRRAVVLAMGRLGAEGAADALVNTLALLPDKERDPLLVDGLVRAIETLGKGGLERLVALADSGVDQEINRVVEAMTSMRTRPAADVIPKLLENPHLSPAQRAALVRSYGNYQLDPPLSLAPLIDYVIKNPDEGAGVQRAALDVLASAAAFKNAKAEKWLLALLSNKDESVRLSALKAVAAARPSSAGSHLVKMLEESERPSREREAILRALGVMNETSIVPALKEIVSGTESLGVRSEALRTLAAVGPKEAAALAEKLLTGKDDALHVEALAVLGTDAGGAKKVGQMFVDRKLPRELLPQVSEALSKNAGRSREIENLWLTVRKNGFNVANTPEERARLGKLVQSKGNARRGRELYLSSNKLACIRCHRMEGVGGQVGPDLTRLWETHSLDQLIEAMVEPGKEIGPSHRALLATTKTRLVYRGLPIRQTNEDLILRDADGRDVRLARSDLQDVTEATSSLMPSTALALLDADQFVDLLAFLKSRTAQESLRGLALDWLVVGPFDGDFEQSHEPEKKTDPDAVYSLKPGVEVRWQPAQAEPSTRLELGKLYPGEGVSAYALTHVYSPTAQKATLLVSAGGPMKVWVEGRLVHQYAKPRPVAPDPDRVEVELQQGWNRVLVRLSSPGLLSLRVQGDGVFVSRTPQR